MESQIRYATTTDAAIEDRGAQEMKRGGEPVRPWAAVAHSEEAR